MLQETSLPPYINLTPTHPFPPSHRTVLTPMVLHTNARYDITSLEGLRISPKGMEPFACKPRCVEDKLNFVLKGGTCYVPCSPKFLSLFVKGMPPQNLRELVSPVLGKDYYYRGFTLNLRSGALLVRKGNVHGRVYSLWDAYPASVEERLSDADPEPLDLDSTYDIFWKLYLACAQRGLSLDTLTSAGAIGQAYLLKTANSMFGHLDDMDYELIEMAHQCYRGSRFEAALCGLFDGYYYDIVSAFPSIIADLIPCFSPYVEWIRDSNYHKEAFYGFARCIEEPTHTTNISPTVFRYDTPFGVRQMGPVCPQEKFMTKPEMDLDIQNGLAKVTVLDGWWGIPKRYITPLRDPMDMLYELRTDPILGRLAKYASKTIAGKMGSVWEEHDIEPISFDPWIHKPKITTHTSPIFQVIYAAHVTGAVRARVSKLAIQYGGTPRADGIVQKVKIPDEQLSDQPGGIKLKYEGRQLVIDDMLYGISHLDMLRQADPKSSQYDYQVRFVTSIRSASLNSRSIAWTKNVGRPGIKMLKRTIGSHKRLPKWGSHDIETLLTGELPSKPPKDEDDVRFIQSYLVDPFDYG